MSLTEAVFWVFAADAIVSAFLCITRRSPVASALWLVNTLFAVAALFVVLDAHFLGAMQVLVYAGAIMVLFLFVIMLLNLGRDASTDMMGWAGRLVVIVVGVVLAVELWALSRVVLSEELRLPTGALEQLQAEEGVVGMISDSLFRNFLVPFELTSLLLLAAIVGAVVLAKRRL